MNKKVSIIVPIYNVETYLEDCLNSIVNQTFQDLEIILVDDGSFDRSPEIMKTFANQDERIIIITQTNSGVSAARNRGLRVASCEYFLFVDSDDTVELNAVEMLYNRALETQSDIVLGNVIYIYENGEQSFPCNRQKEIYNQTNMSGEDCYVVLMENKTFPPLVYLFFMKRELIFKYNMFFKEDVIHEDELWCVQAMLSAQRVSLIDFYCYNYFQRNGSLMHSNNHEFRIQSLFLVCKELNIISEKFKKENKMNVVSCIFMKIFNLYLAIIALMQYVDNHNIDYHYYFSILLRENYSHLSYISQRECLINYCFSNPQIQKKMAISINSLINS